MERGSWSVSESAQNSRGQLVTERVTEHPDFVSRCRVVHRGTGRLSYSMDLF
jgi:hypothetical protein